MKILIPVFVGAIIGYCTNWLAIKMVFKPVEEKKILGIKIPFTPGLIPKERYRIAKSVGEVVGENLLSREKIAEILSSRATRKKIQKLFLLKIEENKSNRKSLNNIIEVMGEEKILEKKSKLGNFLCDYILARVKEYNLEGFVSRAMDYDLIVQEFIGKIEEDEKTIGETIPKEINEKFPKIIEENREFIISSLRELLEGEETSERIRNEIGNFLDNSMGKMITMFIGIDTIAEKVINGISKYLYTEQGEENILELTNGILDKAMDLEVKSLSTLFESVNILELEKLGNRFLLKKIDEIIHSENFEFIIRDNIERSMEKILNMEIGEIIDFIDVENLEETISDLHEISSQSIETLVIELVNLFDISKIVEDEINSFEIEYTEKLILDIADRELKAITRLGALLGAILGLLAPLLQTI